jgi:hypothetical protein
MNTFEPNSQTPPEFPAEPNTVTECMDSADFYFDGPGDTTVRPRRSEVPRFWPADLPLPDSSNHAHEQKRPQDE